jgi:hypothetical protein
MSYRDDLDAAQHRSEALQRQVTALERTNRELARGRRRFELRDVVPPLLVTLLSGTMTGLALTLGWGTVWAGLGGLMTILGLLSIMGASSPGMPQGAVPLRAGVAAPRPLVAIGVATIATEGDAGDAAAAAFDDHELAQVAAVAAALLETALRDGAATAPDDDALRERVTALARERLAGVGLVLQALSVGPAA